MTWPVIVYAMQRPYVDVDLIRPVVETLQEFLTSPAEWDHPQIEYVTLQVDRSTRDAARSALAALPPEVTRP